MKADEELVNGLPFKKGKNFAVHKGWVFFTSPKKIDGTRDYVHIDWIFQVKRGTTFIEYEKSSRDLLNHLQEEYIRGGADKLKESPFVRGYSIEHRSKEENL